MAKYIEIIGGRQGVKITAMIIAVTHLINIRVCFLVKGKPYYDVLKLLAII